MYIYTNSKLVNVFKQYNYKSISYTKKKKKKIDSLPSYVYESFDDGDNLASNILNFLNSLYISSLGYVLILLSIYE